MWKEFKEFAFKGNVIDLAVGVMIGGAFGKIVTSVVNDLFMPVLSLITGSLDFTNMFITMKSGVHYEKLVDAQADNVATFNYGAFITNVIDFLLIALSIFLFIKVINKLNRKKAEPAPVPVEEARKCPYCRSEIAKDATRCPFCTSILEEKA